MRLPPYQIKPLDGRTGKNGYAHSEYRNTPANQFFHALAVERFRLWRECMLRLSLRPDFDGNLMADGAAEFANFGFAQARAWRISGLVQTSAHEGHELYAELCHEDGGCYVECGCRTCDQVHSILHPRAALDLAGAESEIGRKVLTAYPQWRDSAVVFTDILKR